MIPQYTPTDSVLRIPFVDLGSTPRQGPPSPTTRPSFNRFT